MEFHQGSWASRVSTYAAYLNHRDGCATHDATYDFVISQIRRSVKLLSLRMCNFTKQALSRFELHHFEYSVREWKALSIVDDVTDSVTPRFYIHKDIVNIIFIIAAPHVSVHFLSLCLVVLQLSPCYYDPKIFV